MIELQRAPGPSGRGRRRNPTRLMLVEAGMDNAELTCTVTSGGRTAHFSDAEAYVMYVLLQELGKGDGGHAAAARQMAARIPSRIANFFDWEA